MDAARAYTLLGLARGASLDAVKSAYRKRAFALHPDLNPDNPRAAKEFQALNEAYVFLKRQLEGGPKAESESPGATGGAAPGAGERQTRAKARPSGPGTYTRKAKTAPGTPPPGDVLGDILKDPFARQVFEDIYSQIKRTGSAKPGAVTVKKPPKKRKLKLEWGDSSLNVDLTQGVWQGIKNLAKRQMDDEQTMHLPAAKLRPGAKLKLTVSHGLSGESKAVEVVLPSDYVVGRPVRLKGLGRKIGPFVGDLYLRLLPA